ncbi:MAG: B12-binding domain-containing radical SAM protein [Candidatus Latescibacteria bacterium]|nr:B12-binding domain-containing radical SAM protein [Candidatus Latescibacterota bacterium]
MRLLLIDPPTNCFTGLVKRGYPIGLCLLAAVAKEEGVEDVRVLDMDREGPPLEGLQFLDQRRNWQRFIDAVNDLDHAVWQGLRAALRQYYPDLVGITSMTIQFAAALRVAQVVKEWNPGCLVVLGGSQASAMPGNTIAWPAVDLAVTGEGEEAFREILRRRRAGRGGWGDLPGVLSKGQRASQSPYQEVKSIDGLLPDRHALANVPAYGAEDLGLMITSRGCPYSCSFCCNFTRRVRYRSVEDVLAEVAQVQTEYGTRQFLFKDDSFTVNHKRVTSLCEEILRRGMVFSWEITTRADLLSEELVRLIKRAGCNRVAVGVESGDDEVLKIHEKGLDKEELRSAARLLKRHGMFWTGYFMMALPMEREEQILKTLAFMRELDPAYASVGVYKPYPGTGLFQEAVELGLVLPEVDNQHFFERNPVDYFFADPERRCVHIAPDRLREVTRHVAAEFERHNRQLWNVVRRAASRRQLYFCDWSALRADLRRARKWLVSY